MSNQNKGFKQTIALWFSDHPLLKGAAVSVLVATCLVVLLWFTVFSGMSSTADFIYAQF